MIKDLVSLANHLDSKGLQKEADYLDSMIRKCAIGAGDYMPPERWIEFFNYMSEEDKDKALTLLDKVTTYRALSPDAKESYDQQEEERKKQEAYNDWIKLVEREKQGESFAYRDNPMSGRPFEELVNLYGYSDDALIKKYIEIMSEDDI